MVRYFRGFCFRCHFDGVIHLRPRSKPETDACCFEGGIGDDSLPVKVKTDLVTLTLTVTDNYGRYISGLKKNAFSVSDNGEPQDITFFSDSDAPVSVGILFDVSGSMNGEKIAKARNSCHALPDDKAIRRTNIS
ncbi:MAG: hypothetical protein M9893_11725 [Pyrinomonadaceae bacterium]|nr:hypothetical protein [Pyrinomonadaceae bacterium]